MKKLLVAGAALLALIAGAAHAADLPIVPYGGPIIVPAYQWSGFYLGANAGGHFGNDKITTTMTPVLGFSPAEAVAIDSVSPTTLKPAGFIGGLQGGYNWQFNQILVGFEVDANWMSGTASRTLLNLPTAFPNESMFNQTNAIFLFTARPRVGWVWDRALLYVTGGYAMGNVKFNDFFTASTSIGPAPFGTVTTAHMSGWTAGLGFEYGLSEAWTVKAEYLYVDLGSFTNSTGFPTGDIITYTHKYTDNVVRAGLNYKFGWGWW
jgi:outer membrane immunogenic protein